MHKLSICLLRAVTILALSLGLCNCSKKDNKQQFLDGARKLFEAGEYEKSKAEYQKVLSASPGNQEALAQLGRIWMEQGNPLKAISPLYQMSKEAPREIEPRTRLLAALTALRFRVEAWKEANGILDLDPGNEKALTILPTLVESENELWQAQQRIDAAPDKNAAAYHMACATMHLKKWDLLKRKDPTATDIPAYFTLAERSIQQALTADPKSIPARTARAGLLRVNGDLAGAEQEFTTIAQDAPVRSPERLLLANLKRERGKLDEARTLGREVADKAPDYLPAWIFLANVELAARDSAAVRACAQKILDIDPSHFDGRKFMGQALLDEGQPKQAAEVLEGLLRELPDVPGIQFLLATAFMRSGDLDKALPVLGALVARKPDFPEATEAVFLLASAKITKGREDEAVSELQTVLKRLQDDLKRLREDTRLPEGPVKLREQQLNGEIFKGALLLASAYQRLKKLDEAAAVITQLRSQTTPGSETETRLLLQLGGIQRSNGKPGEALKSLEDALKNSPGNIPAIFQLVELDAAAGNFESAHGRIQPLMAKSPVPAEAHFLQGAVFAAQKKWDEAEAALSKALETNPEYDPALKQLVDVYMKANKPDAALQRVVQKLATHPEDVNALTAAGLICEGKKDFAQALQYYEKLLSVRPGLPLVMNNLANLYLFHQKDPEKAYKLALEARNLRPEPESALGSDPLSAGNSAPFTPVSFATLEPAVIADTLGWIQLKRKNYAEAYDLVREAAKTLSPNGEVQYHVGVVSAMMGELDAAAAALAKAAEPNSGLPDNFAEKAELQTYRKLLDGTAKSSRDIEPLTTQDPGNPFYEFLLGRALEGEKENAKAEAAYGRALKSNPRMMPALLGLARLVAADPARKSETLELVKRARQFDPAPQQLGELGSIAMRAGDHTWAQPLLSQSVLSSGGKAPPALLEDLALASYYLGRIVEARKHMQAVLEASPPPDLAGRATTFLKLTSLDDSEAEGALQADDQSAAAQVLRAAMLSRQGKAAEAEAICKALLSRIPGFAPAQARLAYIYAASSDTREQAGKLASEARRILEQDDAALSHQADLLAALGCLSYYDKDFNRAIQMLERIPPERRRAESRFYLGMSLFKSGDKPKGIEALTSALQSGLADEFKAEATAIIQSEGGK